MSDVRQVPTSDGRRLEVLVEGSVDGLPLVYHSGTPSGAAPFPLLDEAASERGVRVVTYSRPGYGASTPQPGRTVADAAADVATILDALAVDRFVTLGWSGGGPHALACAALLPDRCLAAATLAGVAPYAAPGPADWLGGMAAENVEEFTAATEGADVLTAWLTPVAAELAVITTADLTESMGGLVSAPDIAALEGGLATNTLPHLAESFRHAMASGVAGWRDDDLAFVADWGFDLASISVPVSVWQGDEDRMVPYAHGRWLAANVPAARNHLCPGEGHLSLIAQMGQVLDDLIADLDRSDDG